MLNELHIENIAVIERADISFGRGLNVLTGETGAGKSIVIDSVNLALGGRADRELIRAGSEKASVQAVFDVSGNERVLALLDEWGFETDEGLLTLGRELSQSGRNICRVAGQAATLAQLRELRALLVELHGQHEHQELLSPARHLQVLDAFGGEAHKPYLSAVRSAWAKYAADREALSALNRAATPGTRSRERTATNTLFSPARVPAISGQFMPSIASAATLALAGSVLMTIRFSASMMETTDSVNRRIILSVTLRSERSAVAYLYVPWSVSTLTSRSSLISLEMVA